MELFLPIILDGATGTQLQKRGFTGGMSAEQWVLEHPDTIKEIQKLYIENGSNIVYTSTFGGNRVKLEEHGILNKVEEYNTRLAALSKEAAGDKAFVAGDISPTGKFLYPLGDKTFEEFVDIYTEQAAALEKAGVDLFVIETMMTIPEARAAMLAVKSVSKKPVFVTFTCDENGRTITGTDVAAALIIMQGMGADAFGLNCSVGPDDLLTQIKRLYKYAEIPLIAKPNAGVPEIENGKTVYRLEPEAFSEYIPAFAEAGAAIFGGCCGSTEDHIRVISEAAKNITVKAPAPEYSDLLPLATEKIPAFISPDIAIDPDDILSCTEDLIDDLDEEDEKDSPLTAIRIETMEELADLEDCQYAITKPLCILCEDAEILEQALRLYQGRALYEGSLPDEVLEPLRMKYGLIY